MRLLNGFRGINWRTRRGGGITITLSAPVITGVPTIAGTARVGQLLLGAPASVTGVPSPTRTWQWRRAGVDISGAINSSYELAEADVGSTITVRQTETNTQGTASATSAATASVTTIPAVIGITSIGPQDGPNGDIPITYSINKNDPTVEAVVFLAASGNPVASNFNTDATTGYIDLGPVSLTTVGSGIVLPMPNGLNGSYKVAFLPTGGGNSDVVVSTAVTINTVVVTSISRATADALALSNPNNLSSYTTSGYTCKGGATNVLIAKVATMQLQGTDLIDWTKTTATFAGTPMVRAASIGAYAAASETGSLILYLINPPTTAGGTMTINFFRADGTTAAPARACAISLVELSGVRSSPIGSVYTVASGSLTDLSLPLTPVAAGSYIMTTCAALGNYGTVLTAEANDTLLFTGETGTTTFNDVIYYFGENTAGGTSALTLGVTENWDDASGIAIEFRKV